MFSHLKRRIGVLTAVAVLAALVPTLAISPASAAANVLTVEAVSSAPTYSACPSGSAAAAGFTDTTSTDVDCIAMYGITTGVTATTYEPTASIPRWQMALYMTRFMSKAGYTLGSGADQGFTDLSGQSATTQTAINQLKQSGVTTGTTTTTFSPDDNVTREQMAMFIERALSRLTAGPGGSAVLTLVNSAVAGYNYTDIDGGSISFEGHNAVLELFELGVTGDTAALALTYRPSADITRAEMATFLTNAAAHTNLRPEGLWLQSSVDADGFDNNAPTLSATHRDSAFVPVSGTIVDLFEWLNSTTVGNTSPWTSTGACNANVGITGNSLTKCKVELGDPTTNSLGNVAAITESVTDGTTRSYYAWTAATNTTYDNDVNGTGTGFATVSQSSVDGATILTLSADVNTNARVTTNVAAVKHAVPITVTAQMASTKVGSSYPAVAQSANLVTFTHTISDTTPTVLSVTTTAVYTDANGTATYTFTPADPTTTVQATDSRTHVIKVTDASGATTTTTLAGTGLANHFVGGGTNDAMSVFAMDTAASYNTTTLAQNLTTYSAGTALAPVARTVTSSNWDIYGNAWTTARTMQFQGAAVTSTGLLTCKDSSDLCFFLGDAVSGAGVLANDVADEWTLAAHGLVVGDAVAFEGALSTKADDGMDSDTVYYVKTVATVNTFELATVSSGGAITDTTLAVDDCTAATCDLYKVEAHGLVGTESIIARTLSPEADATWNVDTRYYVSTAGLTAQEFGLNVTSNATAVDDVVTTPIDDCTLTTCELFIYHPSATADRTSDPSGTASVAWNDSTTTSGADTVSVYSSATVEAAQTSYRTITPVVGTTISDDQTAIDITEESVGGAVAGSVLMTPLIWDDANNTLVIQVNHGVSNPAVAANTQLSPLQSVEYLLFAYDESDVFFKDNGAVATTFAGFEGSYSMGQASPGLNGHLADGAGGVAFTAGDMQHIDYEVLAGNVSVFYLGE